MKLSSLFIMNIIFNSFTLFSLIRFYNHIYIIKDSFSKKIYWMSASLSLLLTTFEVWDKSFYFPLFTLIVSFSLLFLYQKNWQKKILISFSLISIFLSVTLAYDIVTSYISYPKSILLIFFIIFIITISTIFIAEKISSIVQVKLPALLWISLYLIPIASIIACISSIDLMMNQVNLNNLLIIIFALLIPNLILIAIYNQIMIYIKSSREKELLKQEIEMQKRYYDSLESTNNQILALKHDFKNHISTALNLNRNNNTELTNYLKNITKIIQISEKTINTGNPYIDSIINDEMSQMADNQISVFTEIHIPKSLPLSFENTVIIFGNLLDNAISGCLQLDVSKRWINIKMNFINSALIVIVENPFDTDIQFVGGLPKSNKQDYLQHGIGLSNVKTVVDKMGTLSITTNNHIFFVKLVLYDLF